MLNAIHGLKLNAHSCFVLVAIHGVKLYARCET